MAVDLAPQATLAPPAGAAAPAGPAAPTRLSAQQGRMLSLLGWLMSATVLSLIVWSVAPWLVASDSNPAISIVSQKFRMAGPDDGARPWQSVQLPDTWAARGQKGSGLGRYDIGFLLSQSAESLGDGPWAVRIDRLSFQHRLWLNGYEIHAELDNNGNVGRPLAYLVQIPPQLLKVGMNRLEIEVRYGSMGGLSAPIIGRAVDVTTGYQAQYVLTERLPLAMNVISGAIAVFLFSIWRRRPGEVAMGMLGMLGMVLAVRNSAYYLPHGPGLPPNVSGLLYIIAQSTNTVLLGAFALAMAGKRWLSFERVLRISLVALPIISAIGAATDHLAEVRAVMYPGLIALMLPTLYLLLRLPRQIGGMSGIGMVMGIAISVVAGVHDYLRLQGVISVMETYWLTMATPMCLVFYGVIVMNRFVEAVGTVEQHAAQLEAKVIERTAELEAANAAKGHFLAAASHDLRQPVAAVGLLAGLLREKLRGTLLAELTQRLTQAVRSMEGLLSGLLDLSRLEAGAIKPHPQSVSMNDLLARIASHECESAKVKGLDLRVHPTRAVAFSDPVLLEQMVRNLIGNAVRYTSKGGVLVGVRSRGSRLSVEVWDTGGGIAPQDQKRIFEDFVQLGNPERNQAKGLGLGLGIVQRASRLLQHPISLDSRLGRGTVFRIEVPQARATGVPSQPVHEPIPQVEGKPLTERHIVVLDDDDAVRHALSMRLREWGAWVSPVASLDELDELLQRVMNIDMLITDHRLCDGSGLDAIALARAQHPRLPALVITGDTGAEHLQSLLHIGVPVLHKPFQTEGLLRVVELQLSITATQDLQSKLTG
jgi:signal transduction histidine kinase/ActR/RegA family two-component response regulator